MPTHDYFDRRSLELHQLVAARLREQPDLLRLVIETLDRWEARNGSRSADSEWRNIINSGLPEVLRMIEDRGEEGKRLRQSSPFFTILSEKERAAFRDVFRRRWTEAP